MKHHAKDSFVYNLVLSLTGVSLHDVTSEVGEQLIHECLDLYIDYITHFIEEKYSLKDAIRIRSAYESGEDVFTTFPELIPMYEEAYKHFVEWLKHHAE